MIDLNEIVKILDEKKQKYKHELKIDHIVISNDICEILVIYESKEFKNILVFSGVSLIIETSYIKYLRKNGYSCLRKDQVCALIKHQLLIQRINLKYQEYGLKDSLNSVLKIIEELS